MYSSQARGIAGLARRVSALKAVPRTGWLDRGVEPSLVESVADHSLGVALLAWASALERKAEGVALDPTRVLMLALVHDLAESETGDNTPYDLGAHPEDVDPEARRAFLNRRHIRSGAQDSAKRFAEDAAMQRLLEALPFSVQSEIGGLWEELRQGTSPEARFVKQCDRLETFLQSRHYQEAAPDLPMDSFRQEVLATIDDPLLAAIRDAAFAPGSFGQQPSPNSR